MSQVLPRERSMRYLYYWYLLDDNFDKPVAVFNTIEALAEYAGVSVSTIASAISRAKRKAEVTGEYRCIYERVPRERTKETPQKLEKGTIMRCRWCEFWNEPQLGHPYGYCKLMDYYMSCDDYCSLCVERGTAL